MSIEQLPFLPSLIVFEASLLIYPINYAQVMQVCMRKKMFRNIFSYNRKWEKWGVHRKNKVREFPVPSRDVTTANSPWAGIMTS
jgi:hypothetical protein